MPMTKPKLPERAWIDREPWLCEGTNYRAALHALEGMMQTPTDIPDAAMPEPDLVEVIDGVAYLPVRGILLPYQNVFSMLYAATTLDVLEAQLIHAMLNPSVKAVVLDIDSPGGSATGVAELARLVRDFMAHKPVYAHGRRALSAALWLASACTAIVAADETAEFGSLGAVIETRNLEGQAEQNGEEVFVFSSGVMKTAGHPYVKMTGEQSQYLQNKCLDLGLLFYQALITYRPQIVDADPLTEIAEGRTYFSAEAKALGLVDDTMPGMAFHAMITNP